MIETGRTRVRRFLTERAVAHDVTLHHEHAEVLRKAISDPNYIGEIDWADGTIEAIETAEHAVVKKTARVVEEVSLRQFGSDHVETIRASSGATRSHSSKLVRTGRSFNRQRRPERLKRAASAVGRRRSRLAAASRLQGRLFASALVCAIVWQAI